MPLVISVDIRYRQEGMKDKERNKAEDKETAIVDTKKGGVREARTEKEF